MLKEQLHIWIDIDIVLLVYPQKNQRAIGYYSIIQTQHFWRTLHSSCIKICPSLDILMIWLPQILFLWIYFFFQESVILFYVSIPIALWKWYQNYLINAEKFECSNLDPCLTVSTYWTWHLKMEALLVETERLESGYLTMSPSMLSLSETS